MKWNARDDDVRPEKERRFDQQGMLVVQQVMPQPLRHELRQDHGDVAVRIAVPELVDVLEQGLQQRPVW